MAQEFPVVPTDDWIIIDRVDIKSIEEETMAKLNIVGADGKTPESVRDIARDRSNKLTEYNMAKKNLLAKWSTHQHQAYVKAVGPGAPSAYEEGLRIAMPVKVGDRICYRGEVGETLIVKKKLYWMIKPHEIFGVIRKSI